MEELGGVDCVFVLMEWHSVVEAVAVEEPSLLALDTLLDHSAVRTTVRLDERGMQAGQERKWSELCWSAQCSRCARRAFCGRLRRAATWSAMSAQAEASRSFWEAVAARGTQRKRVWFSAWSAVVDDSAQGWRVKPLGRARSARTREESTPSLCELSCGRPVGRSRAEGCRGYER